jgi:hypothetical protein
MLKNREQKHSRNSSSLSPLPSAPQPQPSPYLLACPAPRNDVVQVVIKARVSTTGQNFSDSLRGEVNVYMALNAQGQQEGIPCLYSAGASRQQLLLAGQLVLQAVPVGFR